MTRTDVSARARHGRVLLIGGSAGLAESLDATLPAPCESVETLYEVIGEIATSSAHAPVELVIMSSRIAARLSDATMRATRRIDPSVRFVLVQEDGDPAHTPRELFDACLRSRHDTATLEAMLAETNSRNGRASPSPSSAPATMQEKPSDPAASVEHSSESRPAEAVSETASPSEGDARATPSRRVVEHANDECAPPPPPASQHGTPSRTSAAPATAAAPSAAPASFMEDPADLIESRRERPVRPPGEPLGDTDLVEALLADPEGVRPTALELITQQTGWADLRWLDHPRAGVAPSDVASITVAHGDRVFGALHCAAASPDDLRTWADWLARWLALDARYREYRLLAFRDDLTGAWNRRYFDAFLARAIERAHARRRPITVMVFDLDDFKVYNDRFGHAAGDEILRETVRLLASVIRREDRVCRIGGDEFAVIFADVEGPRAAGSTHPESVEQIAQRFQNEICQMHFPKLGIEAPGTISISAGLATYPWDGSDAQTLLRHADELALQSKRKGKNVLTFGPGASAVCRGCNPES